LAGSATLIDPDGELWRSRIEGLLGDAVAAKGFTCEGGA
jgi:hypothetical protein